MDSDLSEQAHADGGACLRSPRRSAAARSATTLEEYERMHLHADPAYSAAIRSLIPSVSPASARGIGLSARVLQRVRLFIQAHLQEPLQLTDLAAAAGISRFHFARLFRASTGESPMRYLLRARIDRAKELLQQDDRSICDIALALCFYDQSHFTRSFRRVAGMSPTQFAGNAAMLQSLPQHISRRRDERRFEGLPAASCGTLRRPLEDASRSAFDIGGSMPRHGCRSNFAQPRTAR